MLCTWANGGDTSNSSPAPLAHKTLTTYLGIVTNNGDWRDGEETPLSVSPKETIMAAARCKTHKFYKRDCDSCIARAKWAAKDLNKKLKSGKAQLL